MVCRSWRSAWRASGGAPGGTSREKHQEEEVQRPAVYIGRWGRGKNADIPSASIRNYGRKGCFVGM